MVVTVNGKPHEILQQEGFGFAYITYEEIVGFAGVHGNPQVTFAKDHVTGSLSPGDRIGFEPGTAFRVETIG